MSLFFKSAIKSKETVNAQRILIIIVDAITKWLFNLAVWLFNLIAKREVKISLFLVCLF